MTTIPELLPRDAPPGSPLKVRCWLGILLIGGIMLSVNHEINFERFGGVVWIATNITNVAAESRCVGRCVVESVSVFGFPPNIKIFGAEAEPI